MHNAATVLGDAGRLTGRGPLNRRLDRRPTGRGQLVGRRQLGGRVDGRFVQHGRSVPHAIVPTSRRAVQAPWPGPAVHL